MTRKLQTGAAEREPAREPDAELVEFCDTLARAVLHPKLHPEVKAAALMIVGNIVSNQSAYDWTEDEEGLRFMLPRLLFHMNSEYALGLIHALGEVIPNDVMREAKKGGE